MENNDIPFAQLVCGLPPDLFYHIKSCQSAPEMWITLQSLIEGIKNVKDKKLGSSLNDFKKFHIIPRESVKSIATHFSLILNQLTSAKTIKTNLEINLKFLDGLGDG